ncbi:MAG: hypothetical protein OFPII_26260 [Osedax symbiont Rs1]|nr:MAG: hypothetical protein OFPII_26260 [Osedax symbiont Rs1]
MIKEQQIQIKNPCVGVCCLDEQDLCIACKRSGVEIAEWGLYCTEQKKAVLVKIVQRYQEADKLF